MSISGRVIRIEYIGEERISGACELVEAKIYLDGEYGNQEYIIRNPDKDMDFMIGKLLWGDAAHVLHGDEIIADRITTTEWDIRPGLRDCFYVPEQKQPPPKRAMELTAKEELDLAALELPSYDIDGPLYVRFGGMKWRGAVKERHDFTVGWIYKVLQRDIDKDGRLIFYLLNNQHKGCWLRYEWVDIEPDKEAANAAIKRQDKLLNPRRQMNLKTT